MFKKTKKNKAIKNSRTAGTKMITLDKRNLSKYFFTLLSVFVFTTIQAQTERKEGDDLGIEQVNVVQDYKPTIVDAIKLNDNPSIIDSTPLNPKLTYTFLNKKFDKNFELEPITAAKMKGEPLTKLYNSYIKVGLGTYTTPYLEAFVNSLRKKEYSVGARAKHLSSTYSSKDLGYAGFSDNEIGVFVVVNFCAQSKFICGGVSQFSVHIKHVCIVVN